MSKEVRFEQAVYGNFPFWTRGYAVLARSAGCRKAWLDALRIACQRLGERPTGAVERKSLFALSLPRGPRMIVGVFPLGCDDQGRPGALAFHALFIRRWDYVRSGCRPFAFEPALRGDWSEHDQEQLLPIGSIELPSRGNAWNKAADSRTSSIVAALRSGRRAAVSSSEPIGELAREVWRELPLWIRYRASLATWAFTNENRFDLVAIPRPAGLSSDPLETFIGPREPDPAPVERTSQEPSVPAARRLRSPLGLGVLGLLLAVLGLGSVLRWWDRRWKETNAQAPVPVSSTKAPLRSAVKGGNRVSAPPPGKGEEAELSPEERRRLIEALVNLLDRFRPASDMRSSSKGGDVAAAGPFMNEPAALMVRVSRELRYAGPLLSSDQLVELQTATLNSRDRSANDAALALRWHDLTQRFVDDRPLPPGFDAGPVRWQLDTLAWSFHLEAEPGVERAIRRGTPQEVVQAMEESLSVDAPLPATSLSDRYPTLDAYRRFLGTLPRR
jgi:hypothetical protein